MFRSLLFLTKTKKYLKHHLQGKSRRRWKNKRRGLMMVLTRMIVRMKLKIFRKES